MHYSNRNNRNNRKIIMIDISLENVGKTYENGFKAITGLNLQINAGEFVVLLGPSGCGKSTILRMVAGLEEITEGNLYFDKQKINQLAPKDRHIGMVFQNYALYPHLTVFENLAFPLKILKVSKQEIEKSVLDIAELVSLNGLLERYPKQLSGGQRQRVALGRALIRKPKAFLFDEPLSNLDAQLRLQMRNEIVQLHRKQQATTIYVTHDQTEAMTMADKIVLLNRGEVIQHCTPKQMYERPNDIFAAEFIGSPMINVFTKQEFFSYFRNEGKLADGVEFIAIRPENVSVVSQIDVDTSLFLFEIVNIESMGYEYIVYLVGEAMGDKFRGTSIEATKNYTVRLRQEEFEKDDNIRIGKRIQLSYKSPHSLLLYDAGKKLLA